MTGKLIGYLVAKGITFSVVVLEALLAAKHVLRASDFFIGLTLFLLFGFLADTYGAEIFAELAADSRSRTPVPEERNG